METYKKQAKGHLVPFLWGMHLCGDRDSLHYSGHPPKQGNEQFKLWDPVWASKPFCLTMEGVMYWGCGRNKGTVVCDASAARTTTVKGRRQA